MIIGRGPKRPRFPIALIHPLGPIFKLLPLSIRRHFLYFNTHRRWGNFRSPLRFTEKIQWRIINDRRELIALASDKLRSKEHVRARWREFGIGARFKIPQTYWVGTDVDDLIRFIRFFPPRIVLKPNHSSGRYLVADTAVAPIPHHLIRSLVDQWLQLDEEVKSMGHWGYRHARRAVFVEERIGDGPDVPVDIRIFANNGNIVGSACTGTRSDGFKWTATYDADFQRRPSGYPGQLPLDAATPLSDLSGPDIDTLRQAVFAACAEFDQVRMDMYRVGETFYFGEFTVYSSGGLVRYNDETDLRLGRAWDLPSLIEGSGRDSR